MEGVSEVETRLMMQVLLLLHALPTFRVATPGIQEVTTSSQGKVSIIIYSKYDNTWYVLQSM